MAQDRKPKGEKTELDAGQIRTRSIGRSTGVHNVHRRGLIDWAVDWRIRTVDWRGRPTERQLLSVGADRLGRSTEDMGRSTGILSLLLRFGLLSYLGSNPIRVS